MLRNAKKCYFWATVITFFVHVGTVCAKRSESICFLWYNLIVLWPIQSTLKSAAKPIFLSFPNKYRSDLSKKLVFGPVGQGASKMYAFKVCTGRDSNPGRSESSDLLHKVAKNVASNPNCLSFFFDCQLCKLVILQPIDLQEHKVPHLKDLIHICLEPEAQGSSMTFNVISSRSKYPQIIA